MRVPDDRLATTLERVVGAGHVLADPDLTAPFEVDWTRRFAGRARLVVRPGGTEEVAAVLRVCAAAGAPIVPQGGNTGLVGGGVPRHGEVVLSMTRLDELEPVDEVAAQVSAGAGVTLARLHAHAAAAGLAYGVDFAARDSATVGGMIATNAGGIRVLRYGSTRRQVLGVEAVTADGRVLRRMHGLVKDNTGYELAGLLAGSEGTLAVVTRARLGLVPMLAARVVAVLAVPDVPAAQRILAAVRRRVPTLEAAELFLADGVALVRRHTGAAPPFALDHPAYLLLECAGHADPTEALAEALAGVEDVLDVAVAADRPGRERLWALRESHTEAINAEGVPVKLDVSLPAATLPDFVERVRQTVAAVAGAAQTIVFGHLGDGNLHVNVLGAESGDDRVEDAVLGLVAALGGSISAEHGVGRAKAGWMPLTRGAVDIALQRGIKRAFDPAGQLNPGVLLPPEG